MRRKGANSGQVLVIAALAVALIISSTVTYIYEVGRTVNEESSTSLYDFIFNMELGSKHAVVSSLANISNGGTGEVLASNLEKWVSVVGKQYQLGKCVLNFSLAETSPYASGVWIAWGSDGVGVLSAYALFALNLSGRGVDVQNSYAVNVTTSLFTNGTYQRVQDDNKRIDVTCNLFNDGKLALAGNIKVYYKSLDNWLLASLQSDYTLANYGNGTYRISFTADIPSNVVEMSTRVFDQRGIIVQCNATCNEV